MATMSVQATAVPASLSQTACQLEPSLINYMPGMRYN